MTIRDRGPIYNLGFGVNSRQHLRWDEGEQEGVNPESGVVSKALHEHPVMRFFAASAATMVGMVVGGSVIRKGGIKLAHKLQQVNSPWATNLVDEFRRVQNTMDAWQGIERSLVDPDDPTKLFLKGEDGRLRGDHVEELKGFFITKEERERAIRAGVDVPAEWTIKQELQQRMVRSARRMHYELPAAYGVQRGITDSLFGTEDEDSQVNWKNPVDVITDFVAQSTKNAAFMITPFEIGTGASTHSWRKLMTYGDDLVNPSPGQVRVRDFSVSLKTLLGQVGADATDLINKTVRYGGQSAGSFSTAINAARQDSTSIVDYAYQVRHGMTEYRDKSVIKRFLKSSARQDLLDIGPGPFSGMGTGLRAGKAHWRTMGEEADAFEKLMIYGHNEFKRQAKVKPKEFNLEALKRYSGAGAHPVEELAGKLHDLGRAGSTAFKEKDVYKGQVQNEYMKQLKRKLIKAGVGDEAADKFARIARVEARAGKSIDKRLGIKGGPDHVLGRGVDEIYDNFAKHLGMIDEAGAAKIRQELPGAIGSVDDLFKNKQFNAALDAKISDQWAFFDKKILPGLGSEVLTTGKMPYEDFKGALGSTQKEFLRRKSAQMSGLRMIDDTGDAVSDAVVRNHLGKVGFNSSNYAQLKGSLIHKGAISKPWNVQGRNVFGLKPVTVQDALDKGVFRHGSGVEDEIQRLTARMALNDPVSPLGSYKLGGMYETTGGKIFDVGRIKRSGQKFMDSVASETHIPLIKVGLNTFGYSARQAAREKSLLQYIPSMSNQAFLAGRKQSDDFYMWLRGGGRGGKGKVFALGQEASGSLESRQLAGLYKANSATDGWFARQARIAIGETGRTRTRGDKPNLVQRLFSVSPNQPDSMLGAVGRFRNRKTDLNNPYTFAKLMSEGKVTGRKGVTKTLTDIDDNELAEYFNKFTGHIRKYGLSNRVVSGLGDDFEDMLSYNFSGLGASSLADDVVRISDLKTPAQISEAIELMIKKDSSLLGDFSEEISDSMRRAQGSFLKRHIDDASGPSYWDRHLPQGQRSEAINTRLDQAKQDIYRYLTLRKGLTQKQDFNSLVPDLTQRMALLRSSGKISQAEFTEARAAILSMQVNHQTFATYKAASTAVDDVLGTMQGVRGSAEALSIFDDFAAGKVGVSSGRYGYVQPALRRQFGSAGQEFSGTSYNPFGNETILAPTFGTAFRRDPLAATASVAGLNTWSNPEAFSGASIPVSHLFERTNRFFGAPGLALDTEAFKGPLDFYVRGAIGKRVLPAVAGGAALLAVDRTLGGFTNEKDEYGDRVYSPLLLGAAATGLAHTQAGLIGAFPGGMSYSEKKEEIFEGESPIRSGRWWPLGNTPFRGGRIQYFRPSWYQRLKGAGLYTDQTYGSPMERLAFGQDFSPLRPLDPYRFERKHYNERPYPVTGEYFTGPWGPLTSALNMTAGKLLKPQLNMHEDEVAAGLSQYQPVGDYGAYVPYGAPVGQAIGSGGVGGGGGSGGYGGGAGLAPAGAAAGGQLAAGNQALSQSGRSSLGRARDMTSVAIGGANREYSNAAYGTPAISGGGFDPRIMSGAEPIAPSSLRYQSSQMAYEMQELFGIYGFGFGAVRSSLGFGDQDYTPDRPVLESAGGAYGSTRGFWDMNLGGVGDAPLPLEGQFSNLEFSEIMRRFVPRERSGVQSVNPIPNDFSLLYPWLPSNDYFTNFQTGDPYTSVQEGELRLPGKGYDRLHDLHSDITGKYGIVDQHKILGDVAPWSNQYKALDRLVGSGSGLPSNWMNDVETTREQVEAKSIRNEFKEYEYKYKSFDEIMDNPFDWAVGRGVEHISHADTFFNTKFLPTRTAQEDWERQNVYGSTFPQWQHPIRDFVKPTIYRSTQRNPIASATVLGAVGTFFGSTPRARMVGSVLGGATGFISSAVGNTYELATGKRFIPKERRKQVALEEYTDILTYVKNMHLYNKASMQGDSGSAQYFKKEAQTTMYGADVYQGDLSQILQAIPKRKREHFESFLTAPKEERKDILSTSGRLERRILQAAWGEDVEERPELDQYFQDHELPNAQWEGWHPNTNMEHMQIKMGQSLGVEMSQMGYYPQQIREANLVNASYPDFTMHSTENNTEQRIRQLLWGQGISGDVTPMFTPYGGNRLEVQSGVYA